MSVPTDPFPTRRHWFLLAAGLCVLFVGFLGSRGLNEPDEGRYANVALAMARPGGDWWEPRMSGYGHYDKPPLVYWATAASFRAFGLNEWAARLPSLLGACGALGGVGWTAYRLRGAAVAWWTVLLCGTSVQFWTCGRLLTPDMLLTGWCTLAVAAWAEGRQRVEAGRQKAEGGRQGKKATEGPRARPAKFAKVAEGETGGNSGPAREMAGWGWWLVSLLGWTLAWWTKATPALIPLAGLTLGVLLTGDRAGRRALKPLLMFPAMIALGSPWYLSMLHTYPELKKFFFGRELAGRLAGRVDGRHGTLLYYVPVSLVAWLPWWPVAVFQAWRGRARLFAGPWRAVAARWTRRLGLEGWIVLTGLVILSLTASKLSSYTLTLAPWAALLMARAVAGRLPAAAGWRTPWLGLAAAFAVGALAGAAVLPPRLESRLGVNSSVREVAAFLRAQGAARVDADRYWPGLEFYLGRSRVRYVIRVDGSARADLAPGSAVTGRERRATRIERYHERESDPGVPPNPFVEPALWPRAQPPTADRPVGGGWWFVRYHRQSKPRFDRSLADTEVSLRPVKVVRIGDFDLYRVPEFRPR